MTEPLSANLGAFGRQGRAHAAPTFEPQLPGLDSNQQPSG
jgi:hypothetical protein